MKRNWWKRALRTGGQNAVAVALTALAGGLSTGDYGIAIGGAVVAALGALNSAIQNAWENRKREGPMED